MSAHDPSDRPRAQAVAGGEQRGATAVGYPTFAQREGALAYPVALDASGGVADAYGAQDLAWLVLTGPDGRVRWSHDGWLGGSDLARAVQKALVHTDPGRLASLTGEGTRRGRREARPPHVADREERGHERRRVAGEVNRTVQRLPSRRLPMSWGGQSCASAPHARRQTGVGDGATGRHHATGQLISVRPRPELLPLFRSAYAPSDVDTSDVLMRNRRDSNSRSRH